MFVDKVAALEEVSLTFHDRTETGQLWLITVAVLSAVARIKLNDIVSIFNATQLHELKSHPEVALHEMREVAFNDEFRNFLRAFTGTNRLGTSIRNGLPLWKNPDVKNKVLTTELISLLFTEASYKGFSKAVLKYAQSSDLTLAGYRYGSFSETHYQKLKEALLAYWALNEQKSETENST